MTASISQQQLLSSYHKFVRNTTTYIQEYKTNVAVAEIMIFVNILKEADSIPKEIWTGFLQVLAPFAPHISEELWYKIQNFDRNDHTKSIHLSTWPKYDPALCVEEIITLAVQINGKVRTEIQVAHDAGEEEILAKAKEAAAKWLEGKNLKFSKLVPGKLVTLVVA